MVSKFGSFLCILAAAGLLSGTRASVVQNENDPKYKEWLSGALTASGRDDIDVDEMLQVVTNEAEDKTFAEIRFTAKYKAAGATNKLNCFYIFEVLNDGSIGAIQRANCS